MDDIEQVDNEQPRAHDLSDLAAMLGQTTPPGEGPQGEVQTLPEGEAPQAESEPALDSSETDEDAQEAAQELTVKALAEKLEIEPAQLYDALVVDVGGENPLTLGQIKDRAKELNRLDEVVASANEQRLAVENDLMQKRQALQRQAQRMGYQPTEADLAEAQAEAQQYVQLQEALAVEYMPEWADTGIKHDDMKGVQAIQNEYLFTEAETALMVDARLLKVFRDYHRLRAEVSGVASKKKRQKVNQKPGAHTRTGSQVAKIRELAQTDQGAAVSQLGKLLG